MKIKNSIIFLLPLMLAASPIYSQIKIKEKVELKSQSIQLLKVPDLSQFVRGFTPCGSVYRK